MLLHIAGKARLIGVVDNMQVQSAVTGGNIDLPIRS